jgi:hypothetical protein
MLACPIHIHTTPKLSNSNFRRLKFCEICNHIWVAAVGGVRG